MVASGACVEFLGLLVNAEEMLRQVVASCEGLGANFALMIPDVEVDA